MKKFLAIALSATLGITTLTTPVHADFGSCCYGGYQPWWNIFAKRNPCLSCEEERLQRFWHDYYDALSRYYAALDHIDWVAYYKNHGYQINGACAGAGGCGQRIQFAPVFVSPQMQWAVPNGCVQGPRWAARRAWACPCMVINPQAACGQARMPAARGSYSLPSHLPVPQFDRSQTFRPAAASPIG